MVLERLAELFEEGINKSTSFLEFRMEEFFLHSQLREHFISHHPDHPIAAPIAAVYSSPTVIIDQTLLDTSDDEEGILCVFCQNKIQIGFRAKQLPCKHIFHGKCIIEWLDLKLECPLCRYDFP